jgi:cell division protein FtsI (penicillin-binding protein 3)
VNNPASTSPFRASVHLHASSEQRVVDAGRGRIFTLAVFFGLCYFSLAVRLVDVSMGERSFLQLLSDAAQDMTHVKDETLTSVKVIRGEVQIEEEKEWQPNLTHVVMPRQSIRDRSGVLIASSVATRSIYARPPEITDPEKVLRRLRQAVPDLNAELTLRRLKSNDKYVQIKRHLTPEEQEKLIWEGIPGVGFYDDYTRIYPHGSLFSHVLGWADVDGHGVAGVERFFDTNLSQNETLTPLTLSLDTRMQGAVYEVLTHAMQQFRAKAVAGAVFHIPSGEARAMVSLPDFDPNRPTHFTEDARRNRLSANQYELGSTFKTLSLALAMQHGGLSIHDGFDASHPIMYRGAKISDFHPKNRFLSVPEIMAYSSNIGTVKMIGNVGAEKQRAFLNHLGMFQRVGIELQEYAVPRTSAVWKPVESATISYGHGISVTPLHLVRAMLSVSGGGHFRDLTLLKGEKKIGGELVSADVSHTVNRLLRAVVQHGTAKQAEVAGYAVGAKTGTAIKVVDGRYDNSKNISSIVAAFPMSDPQFLIFVMLDEPHGTKETFGFATAGWVAAPAVAQIVKAIAPMAGMAPTYHMPEDEIDHMILTAEARAKAGQPYARVPYVQRTSY